ncbi:MAG: MaoC family dehydratase [Acidisphaera sp.]|nr:MaoC family dehydratase [Acidisphaera sp.]
MAEPLHFEDFAVGRRFRCGTRRVDAEAIKAFARDYDPQPFHVDDAKAADSFFKGLAASGWHTAAMCMRLLVDGLPIAGGIISAGGTLEWKLPVRPGDTLGVEAEVLEARASRSRPEQGLVKLRISTRNQHGEDVQVFSPTVFVPRRASAGAGA